MSQGHIKELEEPMPIFFKTVLIIAIFLFLSVGGIAPIYQKFVQSQDDE